MADEQIPSSEEIQEAGAEPKKAKRGRKFLIIVLVLIVLVAVVGAGGFYRWRHRGAASPAAKKVEPADRAEDSEVKEVIELQPFIVNLADKNETRYLRMTISLGVGETSEGKADPLFTTRVRNAILGVITTRTSDQILTSEGKAHLRKDMLEAARTAVEKPEVHAIYITDFIVQM
jgi:flagellar FliL protein